MDNTENPGENENTNAAPRLGHLEVLDAFVKRTWEGQKNPRPPRSTTVGVTRDFRVLRYNGEDPLAFWVDDRFMVVNGDNVSWSHKLRREMQRELLERVRPSDVIIPFSTLGNLFNEIVDATETNIVEGEIVDPGHKTYTRWCLMAQMFEILDLTPVEWRSIIHEVTVPQKKMKFLVERDGRQRLGLRCQARKGMIHFEGYSHDDVANVLFGRHVDNGASMEIASLHADMHAQSDVVRNRKVVLDSKSRKLTVTYERHSLGSCLFKLAKRYYLSARSGPGEMQRGSDGYFLVQLPRRADNIEHAFRLLRPRRVNGNHKRQGEFFFVPTKFTDDTDIVRSVRPTLNVNSMVPTNGVPAVEFEDDSFERFEDYNVRVPGHVFDIKDENGRRRTYVSNHRLDTDDPHIVNVVNAHAVCGNAMSYVCDGEPRYGGRLPQNYIHRRHDIASILRPGHGGNAHIAEALIFTRGKKPRIFVKGVVSHSQHRPVKLNRWHEVFINTAKRSWSINGRVD